MYIYIYIHIWEIFGRCSIAKFDYLYIYTYVKKTTVVIRWYGISTYIYMWYWYVLTIAWWIGWIHVLCTVGAMDTCPILGFSRARECHSCAVVTWYWEGAAKHIKNGIQLGNGDIVGRWDKWMGCRTQTIQLEFYKTLLVSRYLLFFMLCSAKWRFRLWFRVPKRDMFFVQSLCRVLVSQIIGWRDSW